MSYEPLHHKYRPKSFAELVGQEAIATTLTNAIRTSKIAPAYLFTGPRGTGKTSSARILAKSLNCLNSDKPTEKPCGVCDVCKGITKGYSLDVIEIDAASNTGVDNIREMIERAQFAPVQCRYKVYVVDECLTGDSLVQTSVGVMRIDDPNIKGKQVLSYNDSTGEWEFKKVLRWLDQGERQTLVIKTANCEIKCTGNHLIRTDRGWTAAREVKEGMRILSPVNVDAVRSSTNLGQIDASGDSFQVTSLRVIPTEPYLEIAPSLTQIKTVDSPDWLGHTLKSSRNGWNIKPKDSQAKKIKLLPIGLQQPDTQQKQDCTQGVAQARYTTIFGWAQTPVENCWQTSNSIQFPQWTTSLETVESVHLAGVERVYDIEVEDNHNFVANGLCLHNCHMLSNQAFNALLKTLEEPPKQVVFVLATTDPQRVLPTIISRCQRFDFRRIRLEAMVAHLSMIASKESISITPEALTLIAQIAQGGLRDAESLLDQLSLLPGEVTPELVWDLVGTVSERDLLTLLSAIASDHPEAVLDYTRKILDRGREPLTILQNLAAFYRDLLIAKTAPSRNDLIACTHQTWTELVDFAQQLEINTILVGQQHLRTAEGLLKNTTQPRLWLEVTLLGLLPSANVSVVQNGRKFSPPQEGTQGDGGTRGGEDKERGRQEEKSTSSSAFPHTPTPPLEALSSASQSEEVAGETPVDSTQVWQQVLAHFQPISRRELLRQMCHLIEFDGTVARISVKQSWYKKVQSDLPKIVAAFKETFNSEVKVNLELANSPTSNPLQTPQNQPTTPGKNISVTPTPEVSKPASKSTIKTESVANPHTTTPPPPLPPATASYDWESDEAEIAVQRLAQFFDGEIIRFTDDAVESENVTISELTDELEVDEEL